MNQSVSRQQHLIGWINQLADFHCKQLSMVSGDASFRRYFRFECNGKSIIAVDAPPAHEDSETFVDVAKAYHAHGVPVPQVLAVNYDDGFYLLEDFGDTQFAEQLDESQVSRRYKQALALLPAIQSCQETRRGALPPFDEALLAREFHLFSHWLLEVHLGMTLSAEKQQLMQDTFLFLQEAFLNQPQVGVHRDYHSRNLMILPDDSIGVIDFQDAVIGPVTYDAVSLLRDCYQDWPAEQIEVWLEELHQSHYTQYSWQEFKRWFDFTGLQRHIKASGIFARLCHRDGKRGYLADIPHTLNYIVRVGEAYPQVREFAQWVAQEVKPASEARIS